MQTNPSIIAQVFSLKNGLELIITFLALSQGIYLLLKNKKNKTIFLHTVFLLVLGIHFTYLNINNIFGFKLIFFPGFLLTLYGPLIYMSIKALTTKSYDLKRDAIIFLTIGLITSFLSLLFENKYRLSISFTFHSYINIFLIYGLIKLKRNKTDIESSKYQWLQSFAMLFLLTNSVFIITPILQFYIGLKSYLSLKIPVIILFITMLLQNIRLLILNQKLLKILINEKQEINKVLSDDVIYHIRNAMLKNQLYLKSELKLKDLSELTGHSERTLSGIFNNVMKTNFYEYINQFRIEWAAHLFDKDIENEKLIKEVMYESGFSNKVSFNKLFKEKYNCTPSQYRKIKKVPAEV